MPSGQRREGETTRPVLVVDDHDDSRGLVRSILEGNGLSVVEAANGKEALDILVTQGQVEPCLIVLDLEMPVMSGWEFLAILRVYHRLSEIPVIITSGSQKQSEALKHGAVVDYLPKPVDIELLTRRVMEIASQHRAPTREK